jgi:hypothetical protein
LGKSEKRIIWTVPLQQRTIRGKEYQDLGFKVYTLKESNFNKICRNDMISSEEELETGLDLFENPLKECAKE